VHEDIVVWVELLKVLIATACGSEKL